MTYAYEKLRITSPAPIAPPSVAVLTIAKEIPIGKLTGFKPKAMESWSSFEPAQIKTGTSNDGLGVVALL